MLSHAEFLSHNYAQNEESLPDVQQASSFCGAYRSRTGYLGGAYRSRTGYLDTASVAL